jgi:hypothetical protein
MKHKTLLTIGVILSLLGIVTPVSAASKPLDVHIVSIMDVNVGVGFGTFEASGPAVDAGYICASGTVTDDLATLRISGSRSNRVMSIYVHKIFLCDSSGETFEMDMWVHATNTPTTVSDTARWLITGGSGPYTGVSGVGSLVGEGTYDYLVDTYDGFVNQH